MDANPTFRSEPSDEQPRAGWLGINEGFSDHTLILRYIDALVTASQLRTGMIIRLEGAPCQVWLVHYYPEQGKSGGLVRTYLTNLITGRSWRHRLGPELELEEVAVERKAHSFLYEDADQCWLMDTQTFEQIGIPTALIGKRRPFLRGGMPLSVAFLDGHPIRVDFREVIDARVAFTFPPGHYTSFQKRAMLDNGVEVSVPLFVEAGDMVRIDIDLLTALSALKRTDK